MIINGGGCRSDIPAGPIGIDLVTAVLPFENEMVMMQMTGLQVGNVLRQAGVAVVEEGTPGAYPYTAGLSFAVDVSLLEGPYIFGMRVGEQACAGETLNPEQVYVVITNEYLAGGGDGYAEFTVIDDQVHTGFSDTEVFFNYLSETCPVVAPEFSTYMFVSV